METGAVMRTSVLGVFEYKDLEKVKENTLNVCKVTHADPRCQASCLMVTWIIAKILQGEPCESNADVKKLIEFCTQQCLGLFFPKKKILFLEQDHEHAGEFLKHVILECTDKNLEKLQLSEPSSIG